MKNFMEKKMDKAISVAAGSVLALKRNSEEFIKNEDGETNLVAILLIIVVTVALVAIFKDRITDVINTIFDRINGEIKKI